MITLSFDELARICGGTVRPFAESVKTFQGLSIDSRTIESGELFVAISGENQDGHKYLQQALDKGASGLMIQQGWADDSNVNFAVPTVVVKNSHKAMLDLAAAYRLKVDAKIAAITGSNGKTTTKEYAASLLQAVEPHGYASPGNLNNLYGLPLAIFKMAQKTKAAVFEIGISTPGEMPVLAGVAQPDLVCITNVGPSHLQDLHTVNQVARAKLQLVSESGRDTELIVNADDPVLMKEAGIVRRKPFTFSISGKADIVVDSIQQSGQNQIVTIEGHDFHLPLPGLHQAANLLAAYAIITKLGYTFKDIETEKISFNTAPWRGQIERVGRYLIMADCYNANPESMRAGLNAFARLEVSGRRVAIIGDMLELGDDAIKYHRLIGGMIASLPIDQMVFVGPLSREMMNSAEAAGFDSNCLVHFVNSEGAVGIVDKLKTGDSVFLKGSRGMRLEIVLEAIRKSVEKGASD